MHYSNSVLLDLKVRVVYMREETYAKNVYKDGAFATGQSDVVRQEGERVKKKKEKGLPHFHASTMFECLIA
jgi:hypothetical protein